MKDLSLHLLDILQNSIAAKAKHVRVSVLDSLAQNKLALSIIDDGKGMDAEMLNKVTDPFYTTRTTRKVGLGIPLVKQNCEQTGGCFNMVSTVDVGTTLEVQFKKNHIDMLPLGDIGGVMALTATSWPEIDFEYHHSTDDGQYFFTSKEIKEILGDTSMHEPKIIVFIKEMINENLKEIKAI